MRKLHIKNEIWLYSIGRQCVVIRSPDRERKSFHFSEVTGRTPYTIERGQYKGTSDGMVKPSDVKDFILTNLVT